MARRSCLRILLAFSISCTFLFLWNQYLPSTSDEWYDRFSSPYPSAGKFSFLDDYDFDDFDDFAATTTDHDPYGSGEYFPPTLPEEWMSRQEEVKQAFVHAYTGYKLYAYPDDELMPVSGGKSNKFNNWSVTLFDSLDTMLIMDLHQEYEDALKIVGEQDFSMKHNEQANFFETVIRYIGGLLSAYAMTHHPILLDRADRLGELLLPVFRAHPSGIPAFSVNTQTGKTGMARYSEVSLAEIASCQLEFKYLAKLTGKREYYRAVENVMEKLYAMNISDGLFPSRISVDGVPANGHFSVGAAADSAYEYFLKQWLQSGDMKALNQYLSSIDGIINHLLYVSPTRKLLYVTDVHSPYPTWLPPDAPEPTHFSPDHNNAPAQVYTPTGIQEHLSCFLPGLLAVGASSLPSRYLPRSHKRLHKWAANGLTYTCYVAYADQKSGLGPNELTVDAGSEKWVEAVESWAVETKMYHHHRTPSRFLFWKKKNSGNANGGDAGESEMRRRLPPGMEEAGRRGMANERDYWNRVPAYLLRPETLESVYFMWRTTGDAKWRERGWEIFQSIQTWAKTAKGYSVVNNVDANQPWLVDDMPSFFLAETLKYLYLLFDEEDRFPADKWVFNTEAHPLPRFQWTKQEKLNFGISD